MLRKKSRFLFSRYVMCDESWVRHRYPESEQETMQWKHSLKKFHAQISAGQIMATAFSDTGGILLIKFIPHKTMTADTYASVMKALCIMLENMQLLHEKAPTQKYHKSLPVVWKCDFMQLNHSPCGSDLSPC